MAEAELAGDKYEVLRLKNIISAYESRVNKKGDAHKNKKDITIAQKQIKNINRILRDVLDPNVHSIVF